jgi:uncharacterized protein DUF3443
VKGAVIRVASALVVVALTITTGAFAQGVSDSPAVKARAPIAHLTVAPRALGFGLVKAVKTKTIKIKNTGTVAAQVTVVGPALSSQFSVTAGGGSYSLAPRQEQMVTVQFVPVAKGLVKQEMEIQCPNCNTVPDQNVLIHLSGNAKGPLATPTAPTPTATPTATATATASAPTATATPPLLSPTATLTPIPPTATPTLAATPTVTPTTTRTATATATLAATTTATPSATPSPSGANVLPFSVTSAPFQEADEPFASVTICATGTSKCTTVNDVLVDTGSYGLRIFGSQLSGLGITPNTDNGNKVGECAFFGSGATWGAISTVDVKIAGEPSITIPIQVIDDLGAFPPAPSACTTGTVLMSSPGQAELNGLLGIGSASNDSLFAAYFHCFQQSCLPLNNPLPADIIVNPVSVFPVDNNGVVVSLPAIPAGGAQSTAGTILFGIGTQNNNHPGSVKTYIEDSSSDNFGNLNTTFNTVTASGFFDTGSNGYFFNSSLAECADGSGFFCPATTQSESAVNAGVTGSVSGTVDFQVANADTLLNSNNAAFDDLGGTNDGGSTFNSFDWGLPFFFGRTVFIAIDGASSPLGTGPYTAY